MLAILLVSILFPVFREIPPVEAQTDSLETPFLQSEIGRLNALLARPDGDMAPALEPLIASAVDIQALAHRTFGNYLEKTLESYDKLLDDETHRRLIDLSQRRLHAAFLRRLAVDMAARLRASQVLSVKRLELRLEGERGQIDLLAETATDSFPIQGNLQRDAAEWRLVDLVVDGRKMSEFYEELCDDILDEKYSLPVLIARLRRQEYIVLDDFSTTPAGQLPPDWGVWRPRDKSKSLPYQVEVEKGRHYLAARDSGQSAILGKFSHWNPHEFPILTWCWKANRLPPGGDERYNDTNDSAAGLYVVFSVNWLGAPKQLKYVWSSTLPVGTVGRRNMIWRPWFFVVESGTQNLGRWTFEKVDILEHYRLKLGDKPANRTVGINLLTDANSTESYAEAYYADLRAWSRKALEQNAIEDHCTCLNSP